MGEVCKANGSPNLMLQKYNLTLPTLEHVTIAQFLASLPVEVVDARPGSFRCEVVPRVNVKGSNDTGSSISVPSGFDPSAFRALRDRSIQRFRAAMPGKSILDLRQWAGRHDIGIHKASKHCFGSSVLDPSLSFLRVHQYAGTLEEFLVPTIGTRTESYFRARNAFPVDREVKDEISGWLGSFVRRVGSRRAFKLTQGLRDWAKQDMVERFALAEGNQTASEPPNAFFSML